MSTQSNPADSSAKISTILTHLHNLLRKEIALLKTEMSARLNHIAVAVVLIALSLVLVVTGLQVATAAAVASLVAYGLTPAWAAIAVAGGCFVIAAVISLKAVRMMRSASLVPHDTIDAIQTDAAILKETLHD